MDDRVLRARIAAVLDAYDRTVWQHWARHLALGSAAAGMALGLTACPSEWQPPGPDAGTVHAQPVLDPGVTAEYAVRIDQRAGPDLGQRLVVPPYSVSPPPPPPPDPALQAEYAVDAPRPEPVVRPVSKYGVPIEHPARPAYAIAPEPAPPIEAAVRPLYAEEPPPPPDLRPVARYAVRAPRDPDLRR